MHWSELSIKWHSKWHFLPSPSSCDENVYSPSVHSRICVCLYQPQSCDIRFCLAIDREINIIIGFLNELMARFTPFVARYTLNLLKWLIWKSFHVFFRLHFYGSRVYLDDSVRFLTLAQRKLVQLCEEKQTKSQILSSQLSALKLLRGFYQLFFQFSQDFFFGNFQKF